MEHTTFLEDIEKIVYEKSNKTGIKYINLSDWNPSQEFIQKLAKKLPTNFVQNSISYIFSSDIDVNIKKKVMFKLGFENASKYDISFFDTGSLSILNIVNLISSMDVKEITLITPSYFSIEPICKTYSIKCNFLTLKRSSSNFFLPENTEDKITQNSCIWITNPTYCTGTYFTNKAINEIRELAIKKKLLLIIDESLSNPTCLLSPLLQDVQQCITIVSPHKALCTNGMKFSAILFPIQYSATIDRWSDITSGCLSISALTAIYHFISEDYDCYLDKFYKLIDSNRQKVYSVLEKYKSDFDILSTSYLLSVYFHNLSYNFFDDPTNINEFIDLTGAYIIPNNRNYFPESLGFSFRLNLCRLSSQYIYALERALLYLQNKEQFILHHQHY